MRNKYWMDVMFKDETIAELSVDGHLYRFKADKIVHLLDDLPNDDTGWFFNDTKDRYCAERQEGYIIVNPAKILELFGMPVIYCNKRK